MKRVQITGDRSLNDRAFAEFDSLNTLQYQNYKKKSFSILKFVNPERNSECLPKLLLLQVHVRQWMRVNKPKCLLISSAETLRCSDSINYRTQCYTNWNTSFRGEFCL